MLGTTKEIKWLIQNETYPQKSDHLFSVLKMWVNYQWLDLLYYVKKKRTTIATKSLDKYMNQTTALKILEISNED